MGPYRTSPEVKSNILDELRNTVEVVKSAQDIKDQEQARKLVKKTVKSAQKASKKGVRYVRVMVIKRDKDFRYVTRESENSGSTYADLSTLVGAAKYTKQYLEEVGFEIDQKWDYSGMFTSYQRYLIAQW